MGIEVNALYEKSPEDYSDFAAFYGELYDELKAVSPGTRVFTVFQLEWMKGLRGGLFGGVNDPTKSQWHLLADFNKSDCLAFTIYPCIIFKDPSEMPEDYYAEVTDYTDKPVLFTESGWFRVGPTGWESSDDEQAGFIARFFALTKEFKPLVTIWSFLYDQDVPEPFTTMGLLAKGSSGSKAWNAWLGE